ncbi:hypothetical protein LINGRAHAP2_LOCUS34808 [Linum grandiflorum]
MAAMTKNVFVLAVMLLLLFAATPTGVSSAPVNSPAKIVNGIFSNTLSAIMKWIWSLKASSKTAMTGRPLMKFEPGYTVETMFDGSKAGIDPHSVEVLPSGELLILDSANNNLYKIPSSLSMYTKPKLVAGSADGYSGYVDGKPGEAKMNNPKGVAVDDRGNIYVADTMNNAIRKISDSAEIALLLAAGLFGYMIAFLQRRMGAIASSSQSGVVMKPSMAEAAASPAQKPLKSVRPPLIPTEDDQEKQEETFFVSIGKLFANTSSSFMEIVGAVVPALRKKSSSVTSYQFQTQQHQHQRHTAAGWPSQESYVIRDEDEPPTVEARTPTPRRKTYAFMSKDAEKMQRWRQGRSFYSGQDGESPPPPHQHHQQQQHQQQHPHSQQSQSQKQSKHHLRRYQSSVSAVPHTYYEQSHEETNEIVFGAVQEHDVKACAPVVKPMDYGDPMYNNHHHGGIRVRSSSSAAYGNGFC